MRTATISLIVEDQLVRLELQAPLSAFNAFVRAVHDHYPFYAEHGSHFDRRGTPRDDGYLRVNTSSISAELFTSTPNESLVVSGFSYVTFIYLDDRDREVDCSFVFYGYRFLLEKLLEVLDTETPCFDFTAHTPA